MLASVQQQQKLCWCCWKQWHCQMNSNEAIWSGDDHLFSFFFLQSPTEIWSGFLLWSKLNCGIWAHSSWLRWEMHTPKQQILVSILVSILADSVYCVLPYWRIHQFMIDSLQCINRFLSLQIFRFHIWIVWLADSALYRLTNSTINRLTGSSMYGFSDLTIYRLCDWQIPQFMDHVIGRICKWQIS